MDIAAVHRLLLRTPSLRGMVLKRVIPCLDVDNGRVVKGVSFVELRDAGDPVELAPLYDAEGADELVFLDITASSDNRSTVASAASRTPWTVRAPGWRAQPAKADPS